MNVAPHGCAHLDEALGLPSTERTGHHDRFLKVLKTWAPLFGLRLSGMISHFHHLLPMALLVLHPLIITMIGRGSFITTITTTEVGIDHAFAIELG